MCGIIGIVTKGDQVFNRRALLTANLARGTDGFGAYVQNELFKVPGRSGKGMHRILDLKDNFTIPGHTERLPTVACTLVNLRAEPTTEAIFGQPTDEDQQPYQVGGWTVVHNGTISNDKLLIKDFGLKSPTKIDSWVIAGLLNYFSTDFRSSHEVFERMLNEIKGSYALLATNPYSNELFYAIDYRPLYWKNFEGRETIVCSVQIDDTWQAVPPYSFGTIDYKGISVISKRSEPNKKCLVVLSGGLDSTVAAAMSIAKGYEVEFLHFDYGCRATSNELKAVKDIAAHYDKPLRVVPLNDLFTRVIGGSPLVDPNATFADGISGSEQAIEWVPARNTIMASIATGIAEAHGFGRIVLGINNEESGGGYTDNVLDLYKGFNALSHWINGYGKHIQFEWPVGSMMKRHIVAEGLRLNAPLHLTWSCYNAGTRHCGACGPCYMRKTAFEINEATDPVFNCIEVRDCTIVNDGRIVNSVI